MCTVYKFLIRRNGLHTILFMYYTLTTLSFPAIADCNGFSISTILVYECIKYFLPGCTSVTEIIYISVLWIYHDAMINSGKSVCACLSCSRTSHIRSPHSQTGARCIDLTLWLCVLLQLSVKHFVSFLHALCLCCFRFFFLSYSLAAACIWRNQWYYARFLYYRNSCSSYAICCSQTQFER